MSRSHLAVLAVLVSGVALAQVSNLPDPTLPPPGLFPAQPGSPEAAAASASAASTPAAPPAPTITLIRVDAATGRGVAWLGERAVRVGDKLGASTVVGIDTQGITLRGPKGLRRMSLWSQAPTGTPQASPDAHAGGKEAP